MNDMNEMLEFQQIKEMLKAYAMTEKARERLEALKPYLDQTRAEAAVRETTEGRRVLDAFGNPPFSETEGIRKTIQEAQAGILLNPDQLEEIRQFAVMSIRLVRYLQDAESLRRDWQALRPVFRIFPIFRTKLNAASVGEGWMIMPAKPCEAYGREKTRRKSR